MARPKYEDGQKHAQKRLEEAFWKLLADYPLEKITINLLSKEANVNHNMIYYYYGNVLEMAETIINSEVDFRFTNSFLDAFLLADTRVLRKLLTVVPIRLTGNIYAQFFRTPPFCFISSLQTR